MTGSLKVWFMNGASNTRQKTITLNGSPWPVTDWQYMLSGTLIGNDPKWRVTGIGDFGVGGSPETGAKDGKDDLLLTFSIPFGTSNRHSPPERAVTRWTR